MLGKKLDLADAVKDRNLHTLLKFMADAPPHLWFSLLPDLLGEAGERQNRQSEAASCRTYSGIQSLFRLCMPLYTAGWLKLWACRKPRILKSLLISLGALNKNYDELVALQAAAATARGEEDRKRTVR